MDILFKCPTCHQELEVDASAVGSTIECPACSNSITIPSSEPAQTVMMAVAPEAVPAPAATDEKQHFAVPGA